MIVNVGSINETKRDAFTQQVKSFSGINNITYTGNLLSSADDYRTISRFFNGERISFQWIPVHYSFLPTMGIALAEGRDFKQEDVRTQHGAFIFNETARKRYNLETGSKLLAIGGKGEAEIIGFMDDIKFSSFRKAVQPLAFIVFGTEYKMPEKYGYIKLNTGTDMRAAMSHIQSTLAEFNTNTEIRFFDEVIQKLYEKESSLISLVMICSLISILISIVGVFGLVAFDSESRRKEIAIRKVHGASTEDIILMFNKFYFMILAVCFVVAIPLAWYVISSWFQNFAYRTPMYWWVYLLVFAFVTIITVCTVTFQNWRVSNENPIKSIKTE